VIAATPAPPPPIVVRVRGSSTSLLSTSCFLRLRQHVVGGGTTTYCLKTFHGRPGPNATVRDSGVMTFALKGRTIRAKVSIVERFAADGAHARQTLTGKVVGGGTVRGGGPVVERPPGHIASSDLRFVITV
jgi:hypothetical protein